MLRQIKRSEAVLLGPREIRDDKGATIINTFHDEAKDTLC